jgi:VanZ family protein
MNFKHLHYFILSIVTAFICFALLAPSAPELLPHLNDKCYHILFGLGTMPILLHYTKRRYVFLLGCFSLYVGSEVIQHFTGRTPDIHDCAANLLGALLGLSSYVTLRGFIHCINHSTILKTHLVAYRYLVRYNAHYTNSLKDIPRILAFR